MDDKELDKILVSTNKTIEAERAAAASGSWGQTEVESAVALTDVPAAYASRIDAAIARLRVRPSADPSK